ncbi:hypothetical protein [Alkalihalobacillus trypoxylicola]|uniref:Uncharacterized protein n=1 Tax=Alkalihalobacillus trypoxylicola TaxID=519424 RepID=A0A161PKX9_9BACI|nr:hypothetical protein [Alkalihalobacillus trypoxylicola]KYG34966.1 hypothetical protein AZF04_01130 [Alkalihalobacillus trypoxylicola]
MIKRYPIWFWITFLIVLITEVLFFVFGSTFYHIRDYVIRVYIITFAIHPIYIAIFLFFFWKKGMTGYKKLYK